ncbi:tRNA(His) guanylyltransferase 1 [Bienertia sinuspersici]
MANSKYEYVKSFEVEDKIMLPSMIVVAIDGRNFRRFCEDHMFKKPRDKQALKLMKSCAAAVMIEYPDVIFSYGFSDEYSFILKKNPSFTRDVKGHLNNLYDTCVCELVQKREVKTEIEAHEFLKVEDVIKYKENGDPVKRLRRKVMKFRSDNIAGKSFWNQHLSLVSELGRVDEDIHKVRPEYLESFQFQDKLMPFTWIVVRIDGCHFHRFSDVHKFKKPNDEQALNLMNSCAAAVLQEFQDIVFAYGVSDEFSFVLNKDSKLYERNASKIVSAIVSFFSSKYISKWNEFFMEKEMEYPPSFDGRAVCYPTSKILRDYLSWRQVDCHINNQYNTCFWTLVDFKERTSGHQNKRCKSEAQNELKGTQTEQKNDLLTKYGIDYTALPDIFRLGSCVFRDKEIVIEHCNIIDDGFWEAHPWILGNEPYPGNTKWE